MIHVPIICIHISLSRALAQTWGEGPAAALSHPPHGQKNITYLINQSSVHQSRVHSFDTKNALLHPHALQPFMQFYPLMPFYPRMPFYPLMPVYYLMPFYPLMKSVQSTPMMRVATCTSMLSLVRTSIEAVNQRVALINNRFYDTTRDTQYGAST